MDVFDTDIFKNTSLTQMSQISQPRFWQKFNGIILILFYIYWINQNFTPRIISWDIVFFIVLILLKYVINGTYIFSHK